MDRLETGPYRHTPDDWQGLFIRGDDCAGYAIYLRSFLNNEEDIISRMALQGLLSLLEETRE